MTVPAIPTQPGNDIASALSALLRKPEIKNIWYNGKEFSLDGYRFVDCRFDNCTLHVGSLNFEMERCLISADTQLFFGTDVGRPIALFFARLKGFDSVFPDFMPVRHKDGTISIK